MRNNDCDSAIDKFFEELISEDPERYRALKKLTNTSRRQLYQKRKFLKSQYPTNWPLYDQDIQIRNKIFFDANNFFESYKQTAQGKFIKLTEKAGFKNPNSSLVHIMKILRSHLYLFVPTVRYYQIWIDPKSELRKMQRFELRAARDGRILAENSPFLIGELREKVVNKFLFHEAIIEYIFGRTKEHVRDIAREKGIKISIKRDIWDSEVVNKTVRDLHVVLQKRAKNLTSTNSQADWLAHFFEVCFPDFPTFGSERIRKKFSKSIKLSSIPSNRE